MAEEIIVAERPQRVPTHPGVMVKETVLPALGLTVTKAANLLRVSRAGLSHVLNARADLTPDMAARLEKAFGLNMEHLLRMQLAHTAAIKRQHWHEINVERFAAV